jgi:hypothetical protein
MPTLQRHEVARKPASSRVVTDCQVCGGSDLEPVLFLGYIPPVNTMPPVGRPAEEQPAFPAQLLRCSQCTLVQLGLVVDKEILFPPTYPYTSGTTKILRDNFAEMAREVGQLYPLHKDDLVVDIGSNDGTLLANFQQAGHRVLGIEPTNAGKLANQRGIATWTSFFDKKTSRRVAAEFGPARLVTATNVFAHIDKVHDVVEAALDMLCDDGIFLTESHYLASLLATRQYDTVYHEHLRYYSLSSLQYLFRMHDLEIVHARPIPTHGGSIRVYAGRKGRHAVRPSVGEMLEAEDKSLSPDAFGCFRRDVMLSKLRLMAILSDIKGKGQRVHGVGAPSRASTLINYVGLDEGIVDCVLEVPGSHKIGKYIPGTRIPVCPETRLVDDPPEYALLLSWHIADELMPKLRAKGYRGKFLVPLPEPRVVE